MSAPVTSRQAPVRRVATRPADGARPFLTAADQGPSSHAPSKMLPTRLTLAYNSLGAGARFRSTALLWRLRATTTLFR
jgi:hypothetical protein